ncbi:cation diffusion facilitator family transporter [Kamptonema cortianum]|uniref:Cation diffusion facilitator family transporter n=1 Tax=Geitlerinema calcuttense NRMC-F 0142 TaxID=2922238 RepID=A0ABT7LVP4_9CYAN|nr:cation diffusion facilitator family transporter [Geitlerinema calcuttense]MCD8487051.1 cation diffusion facilitator family transporter [Desertifilum sp.]MDK3155778.1 cation diffusion facilitator family transporter [Kamptonema cortianum]MDL5045653.1 cation diffusion facilitator family transporter [Oscillatoria amoena NRMC-F 0135]MDL5056111.1 cation diffusion facilitator family transporter [Geitlerinema calcuttense NRMC-F 0142]
MLKPLPPDRSHSLKVQRLKLALALLSSFFVLEMTAALGTGSLSLLADAGHVLSDVTALGITFAALWWTQKHAAAAPKCPIPSARSFSVEAIAAFINGLSLMAIAFWIGTEAIARLSAPAPEIPGIPMLLTALVGLLVNSCNIFWLGGCGCHDLNLRGAVLHIFADICASLGVIIAAIAVVLLHWTWADGAISLIVSGSIVLIALPFLFESLRQLLFGIPAKTENCDCDSSTPEKLLFPTLEDLVKQKSI